MEKIDNEDEQFATKILTHGTKVAFDALMEEFCGKEEAKPYLAQLSLLAVQFHAISHYMPLQWSTDDTDDAKSLLRIMTTAFNMGYQAAKKKDRRNHVTTKTD